MRCRVSYLGCSSRASGQLLDSEGQSGGTLTSVNLPGPQARVVSELALLLRCDGCLVIVRQPSCMVSGIILFQVMLGSMVFQAIAGHAACAKFQQ